MNEIIESLINANRGYAEDGSFPGNISAERRRQNGAGQKPFAAVITCSDSRVIPEVIFSAGIGELFVIRTAGNVIGASEEASLEYAVDHLHVKTVVVMGHTGCGAVNAALRGEFGGRVGLITKRIKDAVKDEKDPYEACRKNVMSGVETLKNTLSGTGITAVGAVYDIISGTVEFISDTEY